ncbi:MAG: hypothetical protein D6800_06415, partial [Candidatus Zixiibacteriota bacterium]
MSRRAWTMPVLLVMAALLVSCGGSPRQTINLGWPPPPNQPRVKYVGTLYGSRDLKRSFFGKVRDFLFGGSPEEVIGKPYGVARGRDGKLYLADTSRKGVLVYDLRAGTADFFNDLGRFGTLQEPVYIALDRKGRVYVSDTKLARIAVFNPDHSFSHFIGEKGDFVAPVGMAFDNNEERLYVVDTRGHKVVVFDRDGHKLFSFGKRGDEKGEFYYPVTVRVSRGDTVYVVDSFHFAVQAFSPDGTFLFSFGPIKAGGSKMARPRDIAIDSEDHLYITDANRNHVQVWSSQGKLLMTFGQFGSAPGEFRLPAGICILNDTIYVADSINRRVQLFRYLG